MPLGVHWLVALHAAAGTVIFVVAGYVRRLAPRPGRRQFVVLLSVMGTSTLSYGLALVTDDQPLRIALEVLTLLCVQWAGVYFLAFALAYTGRERILHGPPFKALLAWSFVVTFLAGTNQYHRLLFEDVRYVVVDGLVTMEYEIEPLLFVIAVGVYVTTGLGAFQIVRTVTNYSTSWPRHAAAIGMIPVVPMIAGAAWLFNLEPYGAYNLLPISFFPHVVADAYAVFGRGLLELPAGLERIGKRAAIDDVGDPVVTVAEDGRIVDFNDAARDLYDEDDPIELADPVTDLLGPDVAMQSGDQRVEVDLDGERRTVDLSFAPFESEGGSYRGFTVTIQDVTAELQREQRLEVLNRILRHNLRNELNVVQLQAEELETRLPDRTDQERAAAIRAVTEDLIGLGEKARLAVHALVDPEPERVDLAELLADVANRSADGAASVTVDVSPRLSVDADPRVVAIVFETLIEAAHDRSSGRVNVEVTAEPTDAEWISVAVSDDGPAMPAYQQSVIEAGEKAALEHGGDIGSWLVHWSVTALGGEVTVDADEAGTIVRVRVPTRSRDRDRPA